MPYYVEIGFPLSGDLPPETFDPRPNAVECDLSICVAHDMKSAILAVPVEDVLNEA